MRRHWLAVRGSLVATWALSCVVGWGVRWSLITLFGSGHLTPGVGESFMFYSNIEFFSRVAQGGTFFMLVSLHALCNVFSDMERDV